MPTPAKTSPEALVAIALNLVTADGVDALTVSAVAQVAGVRAPSLYKHFADREALLMAVEIAVLHALEATLRMKTQGSSPVQRLRSMAHVYRQFALEAPHRYGMIYRRSVGENEALAAACLFSAKPLFEELEAARIPQGQILALSRTLVAFLHGFVSMEIAEAFRLGGSIDVAFEEGLETILPGIG